LIIDSPAVGELSDPNALLERWVPGESAWFSGPRGSLLAHGCHRRVGTADPVAVEALLREVEADGVAPPVVLGALPFDSDAAPALVVPELVRRGTALSDAVVTPPSAPRSAVVGRMRPCPEPAGYEAMVSDALGRMAAGELDKVVLARILELTARMPVDMPVMLRELAARDPHGYLFAVGLPTPGPGPRTLIGASPELLISRRDGVVLAQPLAGSAPRHPDPIEDERLGAELLASAKNRHEHALVADAVADALDPLCADLVVPDVPSLVRTETLWHLSTRLEGRVDPRRPGTSALALARALHPTPAVCGVPRDAARAAIEEIEPFDRGFYAGTVGWTDATGDGEWVVALRCGQVEGSSVRLYAGAGIVPGSCPAAELEETAVKLQTQLRALRLDASA